MSEPKTYKLKSILSILAKKVYPYGSEIGKGWGLNDD